jgi:DNA-binding beta-propeller fold protein YncE
LAFDSVGNLYVTNSSDNAIEKFSSSGIGTPFNVSGTLDDPYALAFSPFNDKFSAPEPASLALRGMIRRKA